MTATLRLASYRACERVLRAPEARQALYDAGAVVMEGTLLTLHGEAHAARRAVEVRVFRRDFLRHYARAVYPPTLEATLAPFLAAGGGDLVELGYRATVNLTADFAGIDRPERSAAETDSLLGMVRCFSEGATLVHATGDRGEVEARVRAALEAFAERFLAPSLARRRALLRDGGAGAMPRDVLSVIVAAEAEMPLDPATLTREMAFYMQAGAHSTANATVHAFDELWRWAGGDAARQTRLRDPLFVQRGVHESLRLHPASPEAWRTLTAPLELCGHGMVAEGSRLVLDLHAANRDPDVFGADAEDFVPERVVPEGVLAAGLSFGAGMHSCLGRELDGGTPARPGMAADDANLGIVPMLVSRLFEAGAAPDQDDPPVPDARTSRPNWGRYPVRLDTRV